MLSVINPIYYSTIGQAVGAMSPNAEIGALLFSFLFSFVLTFNGVLQPFSQLGWWRWMYRLSPYTYLIEGLLGQALGKQLINCAPVEFVTLNPPSGLSCQDYMAALHVLRWRLLLLELNFNIFYGHRWRNVGFMVAFIVFNIVATYIFTYLFRIRTGSLFPSFKRTKKN
ncbi:hypothetical protein FA13DRAFT_1805614 [Coprinellus micaceus]|uniref:ABC-2 type transporter domain-containing protein n=1 Tax=Coprinellus micaceus TaxID=71717 RepID=A0A4Y7RYI6_COPMI|nr:hypothetical protein FA13DRAFT_1805614 [Coprinellus micaceus]